MIKYLLSITFYWILLITTISDNIKAQDIEQDSLKNSDSYYLLLNNSLKSKAISTINEKDFSYGSYYSLDAIKGKVAGLSISKKGGAPGTYPDYHIRGLSTIYCNQSPLLVIDGVVGASAEFLSTDDIKSFTILKDATSSALYGYQGSNGVILVETKKPSKSKPLNIDVNQMVAFNSISNKLDLLTSNEIREYANDLLKKEQEHNPSLTLNDVFTDGGANTDWQDEIFQNSISNITNVALHGTINNTSYRGSITNKSQGGTVIETGTKNFNTSLFLSQNLFKEKLNINGNVRYYSEEIDFIPMNGWDDENVLYHTYHCNPTDPVINDAGTYTLASREFMYYNPVAVAKYIDNQERSSGRISRIEASYIITKGIKLGTVFSNNHHNIETYHHKEPTENGINIRYEFEEATKDEYIKTSIRPYLQASHTFGKHNFNLLGSYETESFAYKEYYRSLYRIDTLTIELNSDDNKINSLVCSFSYNFDRKYYLDVNLRKDKLDNQTVERTGEYSSISLAWDIKNEKFLKSNKIISSLLLKAGLGSAGNSKLVYDEFRFGERDFIYVELYNYLKSLTLDEIYLEKVIDKNIGFEIGFFNDRISFAGNTFSKTSENILIPKPKYFPHKSFFDEFQETFEQTNKGIEWSLALNIINSKSVKWNSYTVYHHNRYTTKAIDNESFTMDIEHGYLSGRGFPSSNDSYVLIYGDGYNYGDFYLPHHAAITNDRGIIYFNKYGTATTSILDANRFVQGNAFPDFELGWTNNFILYDKFYLDVSARAVIGHSIYNATRMFMSYINILPSLNTTQDCLDEFGGYDHFQPKISSIYLEDASFYKLDNITIGYILKSEKLKWLNSMEFYCGAKNILTITDYKGLDPELSYNFDLLGIDNYSTYPPNKSFYLGMKIRI